MRSEESQGTWLLLSAWGMGCPTGEQGGDIVIRSAEF